MGSGQGKPNSAMPELKTACVSLYIKRKPFHLLSQVDHELPYKTEDENRSSSRVACRTTQGPSTTLRMTERCGNGVDYAHSIGKPT